MRKHFVDLQNGKAAFSVFDNMAMDTDGKFMV